MTVGVRPLLFSILFTLGVLADRAPAAEPAANESFGGVGMSLGKDGQVLAVMPDSPAARAGVAPGDRIAAIDGTKTEGLSLADIVSRVRGPVGGKLAVTLVSAGRGGRRVVTLTREALTVTPQRQFELARQGAEHGFVDSEAELGACYYQGRGTDKDFGSALRWLKKAADGGSASAQYYLGLMYFRGEGASQDASEAFFWWRRSGESGFRWAQHNLGYLYINGHGVERNALQAYRWYTLAARQGDQGAAADAQKIAAALTPAQLEEAQALLGGSAASSPPAAAGAEAEKPAVAPAIPKPLAPAEKKDMDAQLLP